jgi:hypothetical protein
MGEDEVERKKLPLKALEWPKICGAFPAYALKACLQNGLFPNLQISKSCANLTWSDRIRKGSCEVGRIGEEVTVP